MAKKHPTRKYHLAGILITSLAALVLLSAGSVLAVQWLSSRHVMAQLSYYLIDGNISTLQSDIEQHLKPAEDLILFVKQEIENGRTRIEDTENMSRLLSASVAAAPQISSVIVIDESLFAFRLTRDFRDQPYVVDTPDWQNEQNVREGFEEIRKRNELYWGEIIFSSRTRRASLNVRTPTTVNGVFAGAIGATVSVEQLSRLTQTLFLENVAEPFILYGTDHVLAHPNMEKHFGQLSETAPLMKTTDMDDPVIAALGTAKSMDADWFPDTENTTVRRVDVDGDVFMVVTRRIDGFGPKPLYAGTYTPMNVIWETFRPFYIAGFIGLCILGLAIWGAVWVSKSVARPISQASDAARAISNLEFDRIGPLPESRVREIDELSGSFNKMLVGLQSFARYVPGKLVRKLVAGGHHSAGSEERELTVMFTDMRNFTALCEGKSANEVAEFLNKHLTLLSDCVEAEEGTIDKYIGDSVMAFWGAPDEGTNTGESACRAALRMAAKVTESNKRRAEEGRPELGLRVGIHTGPLVVGDIGSPSRINYTVVGDVVNATQRIEALGKEVAPDDEVVILITDATYAMLPETFEVKDEGAFQVKGRQRKIEVYRLLGGPGTDG
ncbi:MAG: adenylate/guanylate cyclase domain-containing protein [Hyphomicrobiales bacterium]